jgi:hypothetical protein
MEPKIIITIIIFIFMGTVQKNVVEDFLRQIQKRFAFAKEAFSALPPSWVDLLPYLAFFAVLLAVSFLICRFVFRLRRKSAVLIATCCSSFVHGVCWVLGGYHVLYLGPFWQERKFDVQNTAFESQMIQFASAYLLWDAVFSNNLLFFLHHVVSLMYLAVVHHIRVAATSAVFVFFLGEVTSPLFNLFTILNELRKGGYPHFATFFPVVSALFTFSFVAIRSFISIPLVFWYSYEMLWQSHAIPFPARLFLVSLVALGMIGSQVWTYKLIRGFFKSLGKKNS